MENKMYTKPQYKCAICDKIHDELKDRIACESACLKKQEEAAKKAAEEKKNAEYASRKAAVDALVRKTAEAINAYTKDYGFYTYDGDISNMIQTDFPYAKLFHHFF